MSILAALWALSVALYGIGALASLVTQSGAMAFAHRRVLRLAGAGERCYGLRALRLKPWARIAQIVLAGIGLLNCPFTLASIAVLAYMLPRATPRLDFARTRRPRPRTSAKALFAAAGGGARCVLGGLHHRGPGVVSAIVARTAPPDRG